MPQNPENKPGIGPLHATQGGSRRPGRASGDTHALRSEDTREARFAHTGAFPPNRPAPLCTHPFPPSDPFPTHHQIASPSSSLPATPMRHSQKTIERHRSVEIDRHSYQCCPMCPHSSRICRSLLLLTQRMRDIDIGCPLVFPLLPLLLLPS